MGIIFVKNPRRFNAVRLGFIFISEKLLQNSIFYSIIKKITDF